MSVLADGEAEILSIERMIFHVVGKQLNDPILLDEITPPEHMDFFLERIRSALRGNMFSFRIPSPTEEKLRDISNRPLEFVSISQNIARDFHSRHTKPTTVGVFFIFKLFSSIDTRPLFALIKYDNEDVVRYVINSTFEGPQRPQLVRFHETFVRKPEAMQKVALVRLHASGGNVLVRDRSKPTHISDYFESFLGVARINSPEEMSTKIVDVFKDTFRECKEQLPDDVKLGGVNRLYDVLRQGHVFDSTDHGDLLTAVFGAHPETAPIRRVFARNLKSKGLADETFEIAADRVRKPTRRRLETMEGTQVLYPDEHAPSIRRLDDGKNEIKIVTAGYTIDVDLGNNKTRS